MIPVIPVPESDEVLPTLERLTDQAEAVWPSYRIDRARFQQRLLASVDGQGSHPASLLPSLYVADLYQATACTLGVSAAMTDFTANYLSKVDSYLRRFEIRAVSADEVRRELEDTLLLGRSGGTPRIAQYSGRGPLDQFVAVAARNAALTMLRPKVSDEIRQLEDSVLQLGIVPESPKFAIASRYEGPIRDAVHAALAALDGRQRTIVRLHIVHGVTLTSIGRMLRIHQSTVSRTFQGAVKALHVEIRRKLRELSGLDESEIQSIVGDIQSRIDLSLRRVLDDAGE